MYLKGACIYNNGKIEKGNAELKNGVLNIVNSADGDFIDLSGLFVFPGFSDVHVHLREPGFFYKETIKSGTMAAAHGGYTAV